jgi:hypothetical protein
LVAGLAFPRPPPPVELIAASPWGSGNFKTLRGWGAVENEEVLVRGAGGACDFIVLGF